MRFLFDTNILIAMSKQRPGLADRLEGVPADVILLAAVVVATIEYGIAESGRQRTRRVFDSLLSGFRVLPFDAAVQLFQAARRITNVSLSSSGKSPGNAGLPSAWAKLMARVGAEIPCACVWARKRWLAPFSVCSG